MDRPQMLQRPSATNVNVPQLETFDTTRCIGTGSGGLKNLADDVGGSKRQSISELDSVLRREWALRIGRTSATIACIWNTDHRDGCRYLQVSIQQLLWGICHSVFLLPLLWLEDCHCFILTKGSPSHGLHCSKAPVSSYSS